MKRLFAILLCVIFALLTACGTPSGDERAETVTVHTKMKARQDTSNIVETVRIKTDPSDPYSIILRINTRKYTLLRLKKAANISWILINMPAIRIISYTTLTATGRMK